MKQFFFLNPSITQYIGKDDSDNKRMVVVGVVWSFNHLMKMQMKNIKV